MSHVTTNESLMTEDQRAAYDYVVDAIGQVKSGIFFLDAPGGTGKTFVLNLITGSIARRANLPVFSLLRGRF